MRIVDSNCGGNLQDRHRYQHSRRVNRSRLQHHSSTSTPMMKDQISLSLVLLIICIVAQNNDMISTAAAAPRSHDITHIASRRSAFCNAVPMQQNKPSFGNTYIKAIRPQQSVLATQRNANVMSFAVSSVSALRLAEKTSADEIIDLSKMNGDVASEANQQLSHDEYNLCDEAATTLENDSTVSPHFGHQATTHSSENSITTTSSATQMEERAFFAKVTVLFSLVVLAVLKMSPNGCWRYYLAGGICASTSHAITTPIDVVKVS